MWENKKHLDAQLNPLASTFPTPWGPKDVAAGLQAIKTKLWGGGVGGRETRKPKDTRSR